MGTENERKTFDNVPSENIRRSPRLDSLDYGAVLADLQAKRAALDQAITSLQAAAASGALTAAVGDSMVMADSVAVGLHGGEVPVGAFLGKSIPEAARLCLQIVKRKMTSREISDALKKGGIETTASNFPSLVHSILTRASSKSPSEILKLDRSFWGLASWYPAGVRSGASTRAPKTRRGRRNRVSAKSGKHDGNGAESQIVELLHRKPGSEFAPQEIAESLGMRIQTVHFLLGKLAFRKQAEKTTGGKYKSVVAKTEAA